LRRPAAVVPGELMDEQQRRAVALLFVVERHTVGAFVLARVEPGRMETPPA
jgi:hypothetical protein